LVTADQIVIATSTRRLVGNALALIDLGEHDLKGISEPVDPWGDGARPGDGKPFSTPIAAVVCLRRWSAAVKNWTSF
jgi:class 3 adenylate cyclase